MDAVKSFNQELSSLYEVKPPISKAKMTALTRGAIKAIKFYKHVVQSVEKFILKCKPEYKVPGLYVIDSIVRQSRHQFGSDKDVFAPRFSKNMQQTFVNLFKCPAEDKSKIIRVLNLWQKNSVFPPEVIQPLFDLADPNNPIHKEIENAMQQSTNGLNSTTSSIIKGSPALQKTPTKGSQQGNELHGTTSLNLGDPSVLQQLQQLQRLISKNVENSVRSEPVHFDKKLLDFDYGDDDDDVHPSPRPQQPSADPFLPVTSLLTNPEVLRQLQTLQQTMANAVQPQEVDMDRARKMQEMKQQEEEFDKHLAQTVPNLPFAAECDFRSTTNHLMLQNNYFLEGMNPPAPSQYHSDFEQPSSQGTVDKSHQPSSAEVEVITLDHDDSRSPSPAEDRYRKRRRSRSRSRDRGRRERRRSRSRSGSRRHRSRSRDKDRKKEKEKTKEDKEKETEKERERKKRGLPSIKKDHLSVCSTTLWVGHLSKLVHQDDLSNTFGEFGDVVSIDLIPPRGCAFIVMLRRQDAARCLTKLKGHNLHGKSITLAWAPGKGVKGKDLKDYWEGDLGVSYVPYTKLKQDIDIDLLEDGGMIDEDTMPQWMKEKVDKGKKPELDLTGFVGGSTPTIDTSQPPPIPGAGILQPPPMMPTFNPFQFNNRLLGMNVPPGMMPNMTNMSTMTNMPNIPIGVPPPNMTGAPMMGNQLLGLGSAFQGPPSMIPPQIPPVENKPPSIASDANLHSLGETLMSLTQSFGVVPQPPAPHEDTMDVEMEDADSKPLDKPAINEQHSNKPNNREDDRRDSRRDDRDRRNRSRDKGDRDNRDRDRDRSRDRHSRDRDRERDRDRRYRNDRDSSRGRDRDRRDDRRDRDRDRGNRWSDRDRRDKDSERDDRRDREKTLNDRLREMAGMGGGGYDDRDRRGDRFNRDRDQGFKYMPPRANSRSDDDFGRDRDGRQRDRFDRNENSRPRNDSNDRNEHKRNNDKPVLEEREVTKVDEKQILEEQATKEKETGRGQNNEDNSPSEDEIPPGTEDGGEGSERTSERMEGTKDMTEPGEHSQGSLRFEAPSFNAPPMFDFPPPFTGPPPFDGPPGVFDAPPMMGMFDERRGPPRGGYFESGPPMFNDMTRGRGRGRGRGGPMMPMGMNMEGPPMMEGPPGMMPFNDRFMRGGRRGGIRGPPPGDFFPGDDFRRGRGRGRGGFNPRFDAPPFDGPPFDGPQFDGPPFDGPKFDGPPFDGPPFDGPQFDGPQFDGPPFEEIPFEGRPQFDGPAGRFRGGPPRPWGRQGPERGGRRSRWGNESPQSEERHEYNDVPPGVDPGEDEMQEPEIIQNQMENNNDMDDNEQEGDDQGGGEGHEEEEEDEREVGDGDYEETGGDYEEGGDCEEDGGGEEYEEEVGEQHHQEEFSEDRANTPVEDEMAPPGDCEEPFEEAEQGDAPEAEEGAAEEADAAE
ncbi:uncharacterized protein Isha isoform X2 [Diabrotica undecimpunctata]|uniref:uncharacterized protein Isha isoform X2 n=1 Tax=Diabrotica undecimpunctata TaxID=50387 RepID=UPI003B6418AF